MAKWKVKTTTEREKWLFMKKKPKQLKYFL